MNTNNIQLSDELEVLLPRGDDGDALKQKVRQHIANLLFKERNDCAEIALAIDSGRGNEKEIAKAIRERASS